MSGVTRQINTAETAQVTRRQNPHAAVTHSHAGPERLSGPSDLALRLGASNNDSRQFLALQRIVGNRQIQRFVGEQAQDTSADILIDKYTSLGNLDEAGLGRDLASRVSSEQSLVQAVFDRLANSDRDDVAFELVSASGSNLAGVPHDIKLKLIEYMVSGVVTDEEEGAIARLWISFGVNLYEAAETNRDLWRKSLWESDQLVEYVRPIREDFGKDIIALARHYLNENLKTLVAEAEQFGISVAGGGQSVQPSNNDYLKQVQAVIPQVSRLQESMQQLRAIHVGYTTVCDESGCVDLPVSFNPESKPDLGPTEKESPPWPTWDEVKVHYDRVGAAIAAFGSKFPVIYVMLQQGKLDQLAKAGDSAQAQRVVGEALFKTKAKIDETNGKLGNSITHYDLTLLHQQLYAGTTQAGFQARQPWEKPFFADIARDEIKGHEAAEFWVDLGLSLAAAAALIAAPFTGGLSAAALVGFGLGVGAGQAGVSWEKYQELSAMVDANMRQELAIIAQGEVDAKLIEAVLATVGVFLDAFGAKAATTGARASRAAIEAAEKGMKQQLVEAAGKKAAREAGKEGALTAAGALGAAAAHELTEDDDIPQFEALAQIVTVQLGDEDGEANHTSVNRLVIQRAKAPPTPAASNKTVWQEFASAWEEEVAQQLQAGLLNPPGKMKFVVQGQYTGSGHGIDLIGFAEGARSNEIKICHFEVKFTIEDSGFQIKLGNRKAGVQTGVSWTENAIEHLIHSKHPMAESARSDILAAMSDIRGRSINISEMRQFLRRRLVSAPVFIVVPNYANLQKIGRQVGGLARQGRKFKFIKAAVPHH